ncbi:Uncharacterised protein [Mycobacterium tuberculosis]|nr:Uncharacterised protein [Mycobacterium tuberculosis]
MAAATITSCQPQNTKEASAGANSRTWQVRCTTWKLVAISAQPPNAKITALVCSGRSRP